MIGKLIPSHQAPFNGAMLAGLALAISLGVGPAFAVLPAVEARGPAPAPAHVDAHGAHDDAASLAARQALLAQAEARLAQGDAAGALRGFEQAAQSTHEAEIELGILRAQMQMGDYRHALAFAAHTAGVHLDEVEGRVFYAWLLDLGAQATMAERTLQQAEAVAPQHPVVLAVRRNWASGHGAPTAVMRTGPGRLAPYAWGTDLPAGTRVVATGTLLADGRHALTPWLKEMGAGDASTPRIGLRTGLGQTVMARLIDHDEALGVALWGLDDALPTPPDTRWAPRDAFAGSPLYALGQAADAPSAQAGEATGQPAWPWMRAGFLGRDTLGVDWPANPLTEPPRGGPVLDTGGRLIGMAQRAVLRGQPADHLLPASVLRQRFGDAIGRAAVEARPPTVDADALYEAGLQLTLQVLSVP